MAAPVLSTSTPADGATDVRIDVVPILTFSTELDADTVHEATFMISHDTTGQMLRNVVPQLMTGSLKVRLLMDFELQEEATYTIHVVGTSSGFPESLQSSGGDSLATSIEISFTTKKEKFVDLSKVTEYSDYERVGPIREEDAQSAGFGEAGSNLSISSISPKEFTPNVPRDLSDTDGLISIVFDRVVDVVDSSVDPIEVSFENILGLNRYDAETIPDPTGSVLRLEVAAKTGVIDEYFETPTGTVKRHGDNKGWSWQKAPGDLPFNQRGIVKISGTNITGSAGETLEDGCDVYFTFNTPIFPKFAGVQFIRLKMGKAVSHLFDSTIEEAIFNRGVNALYEANSTGRNKNWENAGEAYYQYTVWGTILDLFDMVSAADVANAGEKRRLGDLEVEYGGGKDIKKNALYQRAEKELERAEQELMRYTGEMSPMSTIRGSQSPTERNDFRSRHWFYNTVMPVAQSAQVRRLKRSQATDVNNQGSTAKAHRADYELTVEGQIIYFKNGDSRFIV